MSHRARRAVRLSAVLVGSALSARAFAAPQLKVLLPLGRSAYQTNETIDVSVVRSDSADLPAGNLTLTVSGDDASKLTFTFPVDAVAAEKNEARRTEHLHLNGRLLRPAKYTLSVSADGATAQGHIDVYSHLRRSDFKTLDWGSGAKGPELAVEGEDGMGFNLLYPVAQPFGKDDILRGGSDFLWCCTMSGGHQMDLRQECDWSDPYVLQGGEARVVRRALEDRTMPNCLGVHFYDEPGLTWWKDPKTGVMSPFNIPAQDRSYKSAFGKDPLHYYDVKLDDPKSIAEWDRMNRWKESFMPAAWKYAAFGVNLVRPDLLSVTQSVYGGTAYADGYYFNVVRPLPVISGHGGYSDWGPGYFNPVWTLEMGRVRDFNKPTWYLPEWDTIQPDHFRLSQYLSFMTDVQGLGKPPGIAIQHPESSITSEGVVESNKLMLRLGTIFATMPVTRPPVAMLYSLSQDLHAEVRDMQDAKDLNKAAYEGGGHTRNTTFLAWMAGERIHQRMFPVVEEDILDGTLAAHHKVLFVPGVDELPPKVISALQGFIKGGGTVLVSDDSKVQIPGSTKLGVGLDQSFMHKIADLYAQKKDEERYRVDVTGNYSQAAAPAAEALRRHLAELGIEPPIDADSPEVMTSRQAQGDIEYLFAVNATFDPQRGEKNRNAIKPAAATLTVADDGRPIYDAVHGGPAAEFKPADKKLSARFRFGPGEMRVFARTARPIGGVQVTPVEIARDYMDENSPSRIEFAATLQDDRHALLSGSVPLQIRVIDPLGVVRYDLYRATRLGTIKLDLPIAANDPAGRWKVQVTELLSGTQGNAEFKYQPPAECGALAGQTHRAVYFGNDRDNAFRFFRTHRQVTIVMGTGDYETAAAQRLTEVLKPWDVECKTVNAADVAKGRRIDPAGVKTWAGLEPGRAEDNDKNPPSLVGFDVRGPVVLLGTPEDNPLIKFEADHAFVAYKPDAKDFPGRGHGYLSWQRDAVGMGQDSVTLIAYDADGMNEAVGTLYEAAAGLDPLTPMVLPAESDVTPASKSTIPAPEAKVAWRTVLPDRAMSIEVAGNSLKVATEDGSVSTLDATGKVTATAEGSAPPAVATATPVAKVSGELAKSLVPDRVPKHVASANTRTAVGYWGGTLQVFEGNTLKTQQFLPNDITGVAWLGDRLVVGQSDGTILALETR